MKKTVIFLGCLMMFKASMADVLHDPTRPMSLGAEFVLGDNSGLLLKSILVDKQRRLALINGHYYGVSQSVGPYKIIKILEDSVILSRDGKETSLYLINDVKRTVNE
jgi:type II secretory pathway component PulC